MTHLAIPQSLPLHEPHRVERWHGCLLRDHLIACVVVKQDSAGTWEVDAQLQDVNFWPAWESWHGGPFETHDAAYQAGQRATERLHGAFMAARQRLSLHC
jgi:hypothetical protein